LAIVKASHFIELQAAIPGADIKEENSLLKGWQCLPSQNTAAGGRYFHQTIRIPSRFNPSMI
jgi:hypothetical protein